jgi:hypothetical protein
MMPPILAAMHGLLAGVKKTTLPRTKWVKSGKAPHYTKKGPGRRHMQGKKTRDEE